MISFFAKYNERIIQLPVNPESITISGQANNNTVYVDTLSSIEKLKDGYLGSGSSDFKHSKYNKYSKDYQKAKLVKYDKNEKIVFESAYTKGYDFYFYDAKQTKDGYIAVGSAAYTKAQVKEKTKDGLIVIYDKNGKQIDTQQISNKATLLKILEYVDNELSKEVQKTVE